MSLDENVTNQRTFSIGRDLALIMLVGIVVRAILVGIAGTWGVPHLWEYDDIATNMLAGRGFVYDYRGTEYRTFTTPGWPFVLTLLLRIGDYRLVQGFQTLLCLLLGASAYLVVRNVWGRRAGCLAGVLCVLHPGLVYYSVMNSDPLPLNALIVFLIGATVLPLPRRPGLLAAVLPGALIGVSMLTRGTTVLLFPVCAVWLFFTVGLRRTAGLMVVMLVVASGLVAPWPLRNLATLGAPVMTSTNGEVLWLGNNRNASGGIQAIDGSSLRGSPARDVLAVLAGSPSELAHNQAFRDEAFRFIRGDPAAFVSLWLSKFGQFWWFGPFSGREYPDWFLTGYKPVYAVELLLAIAGIVIGIRSRQRAIAWLFVAMPVAISVFQSLFYVQGRHRWMVESFVIVFVAVAATHVYGWFFPSAGVAGEGPSCAS